MQEKVIRNQHLQLQLKSFFTLSHLLLYYNVPMFMWHHQMYTNQILSQEKIIQKRCKHYMIPHHCAYFCCCACFGIKNINVSTRFDQIHQLFHKILSINIILKCIKGHNCVETFGKIMCTSHNMDHLFQWINKKFIKIHSLFLKILRKIEILTSIKGHFGKISCVSHNTAYTKFHQNPPICSQDIKCKYKILTNQGP